ncbi:MAG: HDIG domain-containing metalloprotein [Elusimicrobiota bacterium]|jgi:putative nucleotidyltransferase with HDIG domain
MNPLLFQALQSVSRRGNRSLFLVGGPPRDLLLNLPCHDWDLVGSKARSAAQALARRLKARFIVLDEAFQIYRVVWRSSEDARPIIIDFAELQGGSIEKDLARRDFTINAMALPISSFGKVPLEEHLIDPFGGQRDLKHRVLRAVSKKAFKEDPLRLLRAFRFSAQFNLSIAPETARWIKTFCKPIQARYLGVAPERVREELLRLLSQRIAGATLRVMERYGLLRNLFPEMEPGRRTAVRYYGSGGVLKHALQTVSHLDWILDQIQAQRFTRLFKTPEVSAGVQTYLAESIGGFPRSAWLKLAGFLHDIGKPATARMKNGRLRFFGHEEVGAALARKVMEGLRTSRQEVQVVRGWIRNHMRLGNLAASPRVTDKAIARFFRDLNGEGVGMILVSLADHYGYLARPRWGKAKDPVERLAAYLWQSYFMQREKLQPPRLIDGTILMRRLRLKPGPLIGRLLEEIQDAQLEGKVHTVQEAVAFAKKRLPHLRTLTPRPSPSTRRGE